MKTLSILPQIAFAILLRPVCGATIDIRGFVYDSAANTALSGATTTLKSNKLSGTTDSKGYFRIQASTGIAPRPVSEYPVDLRGTVLTYEIPQGAQMPVSISFADIAGRGASLYAGTSTGGVHRMDLARRFPTPGLYLLRTIVGEQRTIHALHVLQDGRILSSTDPGGEAGRAAAAPWDTLVVTKSGYNTRSILLATATDSVSKVLLGATPTSGVPVEASLAASPVGFANYGSDYSTAVTGGGTAAPTTVTTCADLKTAAADKNPRVIRISGTIKTTDCNGGSAISIASNKTIIGADKNATIYGGLVASNQSNIILRNFNMHGIWPNSGPDDAIAFHGCNHFWVDHLNIWDGGDGNLDITNASSYGTVSWCKFWYTDASHPHRLCALIGSGAGDHPEDWGKNKITYHHNWFASLVNERMPRLMYGQGHVYNDYYTSKGNGYCIGFGSYGSVLIENNYFKDVKNPISYMYDIYAWVVQRGNTFDNTTGTGKELNGKYGSRFIEVDTYGDQHFNVEAFDKAPYTYTMDKATEVPNLVGTYAGPL